MLTYAIDSFAAQIDV